MRPKPLRTPRRVPLRRRIAATVATVAAGAVVGGMAGTTADAAPGPIRLQILSFNDYHGHIAPPSGNDGVVTTTAGPVPAGGSEFLTTHLRQLRQGTPNSLTVAAGDLIGGSPFLSGLFKDEPSVETLNALGLDISGVGNHEFDEGIDELLRMQYGGCHPVEGCFDEDGYSGANFKWLAANVAWKRHIPARRPANAPGYGGWNTQLTGRTVLPPTAVKIVGGVKVGFIGLTLEGTPELVAQAGIKDLHFRDEVYSANLAAEQLRRSGVQAMVVLLHEGGLPPSGSAYDFACNSEGGAAVISGPIVDIAKKLSPSIDLVVTGHTHQPYVCDIPDPLGRSRWVTSAQSFGRLITETNLLISRTSKDVIRSSVVSQNHVVTRDVEPAADQTATVAKWTGISAPLANRVIGSQTADILRGPNNARDVETSLGDLIADAQLDATDEAASGGSVIALMNPGGVRADLLFAQSTALEGDGNITYGEAFTVQPFGNLLYSLSLTGAQIEQALEQQWSDTDPGPGVTERFLHLGVSEGFTYAWSASAPFGNRIDPASIKLNGVTLDPATTYRVTVNSFLADGGDGFTALIGGTNRVGGGVDLDAFTAYLGANSPVTGPVPNRVTRLP